MNEDSLFINEYQPVIELLNYRFNIFTILKFNISTSANCISIDNRVFMIIFLQRTISSEPDKFDDIHSEILEHLETYDTFAELIEEIKINPNLFVDKYEEEEDLNDLLDSAKRLRISKSPEERKNFKR